MSVQDGREAAGAKAPPAARNRIPAIGLIVAVFALALDQASKWLILGLVFPPDDRNRFVEILPVFDIVLVWNRGVSFGMFGAGAVPPWALTAMSFVIAVGLVFWIFRSRGPLLATGLGLVVGGATGNALDRLVHGAVVDFISWHYDGYYWPAFNVADAGITLGAIAILADGLFGRREPRTGPAE